jgi:hypothetical protein
MGKENNGKNNCNRMSRFALLASLRRYTPERATALAGDPVFGRAVAPFGAAFFMARVKRILKKSVSTWKDSLGG